MTGEEFVRAVLSDNTPSVKTRAQDVKQKLIELRGVSEREFQETVWQIIGAVRDHRAVMRQFRADFITQYGVAPEDEIARRPVGNKQRRQWKQQEDVFSVLEAVADAIGVPADVLEPRVASAPLSQ